MEFINPIILERAYLSLQKQVTFSEEKQFIAARSKALGKKQEALIVLLDDEGNLCGNCNIRKGTLTGDAHNVEFGLAIAKQHRGKGFGRLLLQKAISFSKKRFKAKNIWISYVEGNNNARRLYEKSGFVEVARLRNYHLHYGKYRDKVMMEYGGRK